MAGDYFDYKSKNPFTIYKGSSPYLYLTRTSGIELKGTYDPLISRGLSIPINENVSSDYKIMAMQSAIRFDQDFFPYAPTEIFEIESEVFETNPYKNDPDTYFEQSVLQTVSLTLTRDWFSELVIGVAVSLCTY